MAGSGSTGHSAANLDRQHLVCSGRWTEGHEGQQMADSGYQRQAAFRQPDFDADMGDTVLIQIVARLSARLTRHRPR